MPRLAGLTPEEIRRLMDVKEAKIEFEVEGLHEIQAEILCREFARALGDMLEVGTTYRVGRAERRLRCAIRKV